MCQNLTICQLCLYMEQPNWFLVPTKYHIGIVFFQIEIPRIIAQGFAVQNN